MPVLRRSDWAAAERADLAAITPDQVPLLLPPKDLAPRRADG
jgi:hypothetical protein